jgi:phosphatidylinositol alpha-1,6-mannosyltransferase
LLATELFPPAVGGSAVLFAEIYTRLAPIPVTVLADGNGSRSAEPWNGLGVFRRRLSSSKWGVVNPSALAYQVRVANQIRRIGLRTDAIVHCARPIPEGVSALMMRAASGRPFVVWTHGEDLACALTSREHAFLVRRVYQRAAAVIANSRHTAAMVGALGIPESSIHVVYPGVDPDRFAPTVDGSDMRRRLAPDGSALLLSVGRLQRRKGHDLAIAALGALGEAARTVKYVIVGDGDERARLEALAVEHGVRERVHFAGEVPAGDLPSYYAACDVFLMPNRLEGADVEGFGIVFLEAAASERPAIGGRSGGVAEAIAEGETGLLVGGTDPAELAHAIKQLVESPVLRRRMGATGRQRAIDCFSWERAADAVASMHHALDLRYRRRN